MGRLASEQVVATCLSRPNALIKKLGGRGGWRAEGSGWVESGWAPVGRGGGGGGGGWGRKGRWSVKVGGSRIARQFASMRFCFEDDFSCEDFRANLAVKMSELKLRGFLSFYIRRT